MRISQDRIVGGHIIKCLSGASNGNGAAPKEMLLFSPINPRRKLAAMDVAVDELPDQGRKFSITANRNGSHTYIDAGGNCYPCHVIPLEDAETIVSKKSGKIFCMRAASRMTHEVGQMENAAEETGEAPGNGWQNIQSAEENVHTGGMKLRLLGQVKFDRPSVSGASFERIAAIAAQLPALLAAAQISNAKRT
ncbi:MAG: hypothetical protein LBI61_00705 [Puniceicoccales bacterium]|jgi:hypothetical protein|nr:hypothetical protein [Puniceicoccales bacterium]